MSTKRPMLNRRELQRIIQALYTARRDEYEFIACHQGWIKRRGQLVRGVPKGSRATVAQSQRTIATWARIEDKIREMLKAEDEV